MGHSRPLLVYFRSFPTTSIKIEKSVDGVLGIRTRGRRMVGTDKTTELWRPPMLTLSFSHKQPLSPYNTNTLSLSLSLSLSFYHRNTRPFILLHSLSLISKMNDEESILLGQWPLLQKITSLKID